MSNTEQTTETETETTPNPEAPSAVTDGDGGLAVDPETEYGQLVLNDRATRESLARWYFTREMRQSDIGRKLGVNQSAVSRYATALGISPGRGVGDHAAEWILAHLPYGWAAEERRERGIEAADDEMMYDAEIGPTAIPRAQDVKYNNEYAPDVPESYRVATGPHASIIRERGHRIDDVYTAAHAYTFPDTIPSDGLWLAEYDERVFYPGGRSEQLAGVLLAVYDDGHFWTREELDAFFPDEAQFANDLTYFDRSGVADVHKTRPYRYRLSEEGAAVLRGDIAWEDADLLLAAQPNAPPAHESASIPETETESESESDTDAGETTTPLASLSPTWMTESETDTTVTDGTDDDDVSADAETTSSVEFARLPENAEKADVKYGVDYWAVVNNTTDYGVFVSLNNQHTGKEDVSGLIHTSNMLYDPDEFRAYDDEVVVALSRRKSNGDLNFELVARLDGLGNRTDGPLHTELDEPVVFPAADDPEPETTVGDVATVTDTTTDDEDEDDTDTHAEDAAAAAAADADADVGTDADAPTPDRGDECDTAGAWRKLTDADREPDSFSPGSTYHELTRYVALSDGDVRQQDAIDALDHRKEGTISSAFSTLYERCIFDRRQIPLNEFGHGSLYSITDHGRKVLADADDYLPAESEQLMQERVDAAVHGDGDADAAADTDAPDSEPEPEPVPEPESESRVVKAPEHMVAPAIDVATETDGPAADDPETVPVPKDELVRAYEDARENLAIAPEGSEMYFLAKGMERVVTRLVKASGEDIETLVEADSE